MSEEQAIDILNNVICDEVIGTYCIEIQKQNINCSKNCENEDCYLIQAIETILELYKKEKEINKAWEDKIREISNKYRFCKIERLKEFYKEILELLEE